MDFSNGYHSGIQGSNPPSLILNGQLLRQAYEVTGLTSGQVPDLEKTCLHQANATGIEGERILVI